MKLSIFTVILILSVYSVWILDGNDRPIIGIFSQPKEQYDPNSKDFVVTSVVKFLESAGAWVMFVEWWQSNEDLLTLLSKLNGIVFPGGGLDFLVPQPDGTLFFDEWT